MEYEKHSVSKMPSFNAKPIAECNSVTIGKLPIGENTTIQLNIIIIIIIITRYGCLLSQAFSSWYFS